jgi:hypothetical protein
MHCQGASWQSFFYLFSYLSDLLPLSNRRPRAKQNSPYFFLIFSYLFIYLFLLFPRSGRILDLLASKRDARFLAVQRRSRRGCEGGVCAACPR